MENNKLNTIKEKIQLFGEKGQKKRFLASLYELLESEHFPDLVGWNEAGNGILIKNESKFAEEVLPVIYKHKNFDSFVRQLHMYDFKKEKNSSCYANPNFKRNSQELLGKISRKKVYKPVERAQIQPIDLQEKLKQLQIENESLRKSEKRLKLELNQILEVKVRLEAENQRLLVQIRNGYEARQLAQHNSFFQSSAKVRENGPFGGLAPNYATRLAGTKKNPNFQHQQYQNRPLAAEFTSNNNQNDYNTFQAPRQPLTSQHSFSTYNSEEFPFQNYPSQNYPYQNYPSQDPGFQSQNIPIKDSLFDEDAYNFLVESVTSPMDLSRCSTKGTCVKNAFPQESPPFLTRPQGSNQYYSGSNRIHGGLNLTQ